MRQGRTDAWIAHQLDVSVGDIRAFKREHELAPAEAGEGETFVPGTEAEEPDLRAEDDALVAEALEAERQAEEEADTDEDAAEVEPTRATPRTPMAAARPRPGGVVDVAAAAVAAARASRRPSRERSTTARRATGSGSTPPCRTTPPMPSTGPATAP